MSVGGGQVNALLKVMSLIHTYYMNLFQTFGLAVMPKVRGLLLVKSICGIPIGILQSMFSGRIIISFTYQMLGTYTLHLGTYYQILPLEFKMYLICRNVLHFEMYYLHDKGSKNL